LQEPRENREARHIIAESLWHARYPWPLKRLAARALTRAKSLKRSILS